MFQKTCLIALTSLGLSFGIPKLARADEAPAALRGKEAPRIEVALLLDTSNSMDGLILQAKAQLWRMVNEMARVRRGEQAPDIAVALFEYGNNSLPAASGYIRMVSPLTDDLDKVSEALKSLSTNGGEEYCGQVIAQAVGSLSWSPKSDALKMIIIAGNEPFSQGSVDFRNSCKSAISRGIVINTIHCGSYDEGVKTGWKDAASLADGSYLNIDQDRAVTTIKAPQDIELERLNGDLNSTYVPLGVKGKDAQKRQEAADKDAADLATDGTAQRAGFKATENYRASWDLLDALEAKTASLETIKPEDLPEAWRSLSLEEKKAKVAELVTKRAELRKKIQELAEARRVFVAEELSKQSKEGEKTLDEAVVEAVRKLAAEKGCTVKK